MNGLGGLNKSPEGGVIGLVQLIPQDLVDTSALALPQLPMLVLGGMLLATCMIGLRFLED